MEASGKIHAPASFISIKWWKKRLDSLRDIQDKKKKKKKGQPYTF